ncbi:glycosyl hydrolase family 18 protein [Streptomyces sp. NPDC020875]|uniref:glycoside hydrolase family 18 protein n=1 Tax=Streptomyces sp. NPDC020875 TaxID=3154898 RepID=UPI0033CFFFA8
MIADHRPRTRLRALIAVACSAALGAALLAGTVPVASASPSAAAPSGTSPQDRHDQGNKVVGTFTNWSAYHPNRHIKNLHTSGAAGKLTHIRYFHGVVESRGCYPGDPDTDFGKYYSAEDSVDGVADSWQQPGWGSVNQLRKLKRLYPRLKVVWSFTRWSWLEDLGESPDEARRFARSCRALVEDPRWGDVFDGIDIDWEYANRGDESFRTLMSAMRAEFGGDLVTATIPGDAAPGGGIDATDFAEAADDVDWFHVMTYQLYGRHETLGPTAPHAPLRAYPGIPQRYATVDAAVRKLREQDVPARKLLLGISFQGYGWRGVTRSAPGGGAAGPAWGTGNPGVDHYRVLRSLCPAGGRIAGTAYAHCGTDWWSYDTPDTVAEKVTYGKRQGLGGTFLWELASDTPDGELMNAVR